MKDKVIHQIKFFFCKKQTELDVQISKIYVMPHLQHFKAQNILDQAFQRLSHPLQQPTHTHNHWLMHDHKTAIAVLC